MERLASGRPHAPSLRECIVFGLWVAVFISAVAALIVGVALAGGEQPREAASMLLIACSAYLLAGAVGGTGFWALHPLRRSAVGWALTGMWVAAAAYGSVGLFLVLGYAYLGVNPAGFESVAEAWRMLLLTTGITAGGMGIPGGLWHWWKERG